jgi:hypothetical protein
MPKVHDDSLKRFLDAVEACRRARDEAARDHGEEAAHEALLDQLGACVLILREQRQDQPLVQLLAELAMQGKKVEAARKQTLDQLRQRVLEAVNLPLPKSEDKSEDTQPKERERERLLRA